MSIPRINRNISLSLLKVYPNPFAEQLYFNNLTAQNEFRIVLYDLTGKVIMNREVRVDGQLRIPVPEIRPGIYFLVVKDTNEKVVYSYKLLKEGN